MMRRRSFVTSSSVASGTSAAEPPHARPRFAPTCEIDCFADDDASPRSGGIVALARRQRRRGHARARRGGAAGETHIEPSHPSRRRRRHAQKPRRGGFTSSSNVARIEFLSSSSSSSSLSTKNRFRLACRPPPARGPIRSSSAPLVEPHRDRRAGNELCELVRAQRAVAVQVDLAKHAAARRVRPAHAVDADATGRTAKSQCQNRKQSLDGVFARRIL